MPKIGKRNIVVTEKDLLEYFKLVEILNKLPKGNFHIIYKDLLLETIEKTMYKNKFPNACELLRIHYLFSSNTHNNKLEKFLYYVNEEGIIPVDDKVMFDDGTSISKYWKNNKGDIYRILFEEKDQYGYQLKYKIAFVILKDRYKKYLINKEIKKINIEDSQEKDNEDKYVSDKQLYDPDRVLEFIEYVEDLGIMPQGKYFYLNYDIIMEKFKDEKYRLMYPKAYSIFLKNSEHKTLSFEEKALEIFNYIESARRNITQMQKVKFSNGDDMFYYWSSKRKEILDYFKKNIDKTNYPYFSVLSIHYDALNMIKNNPFIFKFLEYVNVYKSIGYIKLSTKQTVLDYWNKNKEVIYYILMNFNYKDSYPKAYEVIVNQYEEELKKDNNGIKKK